MGPACCGCCGMLCRPRNYDPGGRGPRTNTNACNAVQTYASCGPKCWLPGPFVPAAKPHGPPKTHTHAATILENFFLWNYFIVRLILNRILAGAQKSVLRLRTSAWIRDYMENLRTPLTLHIMLRYLQKNLKVWWMKLRLKGSNQPPLVMNSMSPCH